MAAPPRAALALAGLCALLACASAQRPSGTLTVPVTNLVALQSSGVGGAILRARLQLDAGTSLFSVTLRGLNGEIITGSRITTARLSDGLFNVTVSLDADGDLGFDQFRLVASLANGRRVADVRLRVTLDVIGVQLFRPPPARRRRRGAVPTRVGGDGAPPIAIRPGDRIRLNGRVYAGRGRPRTLLRDCDVRVSNNARFLRVVVGRNNLRLRRNRRFPATREGKISVECPEVAIDGEVAETDVDVIATEF